MIKKITLSELKAGEKADVKEMSLGLNIKRRLQDLGVIPGTQIECYLKNSNNSIAAYIIRDAVIALRKCDTDNIFVERRR